MKSLLSHKIDLHLHLTNKHLDVSVRKFCFLFSLLDAWSTKGLRVLKRVQTWFYMQKNI